LREQQVEAKQLLEAVQNALEQDGAALLSKEEQGKIISAMEALRDILQTTDHLALKRATTNLNDATVAFAQARMDSNVAHALSGRKLSELES
jgi:molecular chaperone HscA